VSLNYDISKCPINSESEMVQNERWETTQGIIFQTLSNGMGEITEANAAEFYARQNIWNRINGFTPFTIEEIKSMVGLVTNVSYETEAKWRAKIVKSRLGDLMHQYNK